MIAFGPWEIEEKDLYEVVKRYDSTKYIAAKNENVLKLNPDGTTDIYGSDQLPYLCSLQSCGCPDFRNRKLPCKHMIYVAIKLGHTFPIPEFDPYAAADYDIQEDVDRLTNRWRSGQLTQSALTKCMDALKASDAEGRKCRRKKK